MKQDHKQRLYEKATGKISVTLTNDMFFHFAMQESKVALKGLVCALKGLDPAEVTGVELMNPVDYNELGKQVVLDVKVTLNNNEILNIELQVSQDTHWIKRSILYLCRAYDSIGHGEDYSQLKLTTHIGIMGYDLFPERPEFYAKYLLSNIRTHAIYAPLLGLNVLSLNQINLATEEDRKSGLDDWARMFLAETWEEVQALARDREALQAVAETMYNVNADAKKRALFEARRKYREIMTTTKNQLARLEKENEQYRQENDQFRQEVDQYRQENDQYRQENDQYRQRIAELEAQLAAKN